jgi:hypothetical protein
VFESLPVPSKGLCGVEAGASATFEQRLIADVSLDLLRPGWQPRIRKLPLRWPFSNEADDTRADFDKALDESLTKQARTTCHERRLIDPERAHCFRARDHSALAAYPVERSHRRESSDRSSHCQVQPRPTTRRGHLARLRRGKHPEIRDRPGALQELMRESLDITDALRSDDFNMRFGGASLLQPCVK